MESIRLLEELESIINSGSSIPFSQKTGIDKNKALEIIKDIMFNLPDEVKQAEWINRERQKILADARHDSEKIKEQAFEESERIKIQAYEDVENMKRSSEDMLRDYIDSSELVVKAQEQAKDIIAKAEHTAKEIKVGAREYADDILQSIHYNLQGLMDEVDQNRRELNPNRKSR